jgi:hypothetical protein
MGKYDRSGNLKVVIAKVSAEIQQLSQRIGAVGQR